MEKNFSVPCKACKAQIVFAITKKGKKMPVDAESLTDDDIETLRAGEPLDYRYGDHVSHFNTCPDAKKF